MKIYVVDDDPDFRALAARAMRREFGADVAIVEIGDEPALRRALALSAPDILVSDFDLKWSDGFAVLADVRGVNVNSVAIMFTGTGNEDLAVQAIKAGFDDYIVKSPKQLRRLGTAAHTAFQRAQTRRMLEDNRDLLTAELYHRLHNNLQLVISIIAFTARDVADEATKQKLDDLSRRVQALSLLQERLYRSRDFRRVDFAAVLREMVDNLLALDPREIAVTVDVREASLPVPLAVPLALIANELITNAMKHAFSGENGTVSVMFHLIDSADYILEIADSGVGMSAAQGGTEVHEGLGMRLVRRLVQQLSGNLDRSERDNGGTVWRLRVGARGDVDSAS